MQQFVLNFEAGISEGHETCREFIASRIPVIAKEQRKLQKYIAADLQMSPQGLSRKLTQAPGDTQRFTLDDFERYLETTDKEPLYYLVDKHLGEDDDDSIEALERQLAAKKAVRAKKAARK